MQTRRNIKLVMQYDGATFHGWQTQKNKVTIQETLEKFIGQIVDHKIILNAAGRTDSGVHAKMQVANFHTTSKIPHNNLVRAINSCVSPNIVILSAMDVPPKFNARHDAKSRWYRYRILNRPLPDAFEARYSYHYRYALSIEKMQKAGDALIGTHDYSSFNSSIKLTKDPVRTITEFKITKENDIINIDIKATGFFHHMVRAVVGTLIEIGRGKMTYTQMEKILKAKDRKKAGPNIPPQGLFLMEIEYKE